MKALQLIILLAGLASTILAHQGVHHSANRIWKDTTGKFSVEASYVQTVGDKVHLKKTDNSVIAVTIQRLSLADRTWIAPAGEMAEKPSPEAAFQPFDKSVKTKVDNEYLYVESNGMPDHNMMVGITAWQQQVPLPQAYTGDNAWRIPLHPQPAASPMSAKTNFFRGARITGFSKPSPSSYRLNYELQGSKQTITYQLNPNQTVTFQFPDNRSETYTPRAGKGDRKGPKPPRPGRPAKRKP